MESYLIDFTIVDGNFAPLLGLETAQQMKLLVVQTQNISSIREETAACDAEKPVSSQKMLWWVNIQTSLEKS